MQAARIARMMLCAVLCAGALRAADAAALTPEQKTRKEAIQATLANIEAELRQYGNGSWEEWGKKLEPFREAVRKRSPLKNGLRIRGDEWGALAVDKLDGDGAQKAILHFDQQLKARGIDLILVLLPGKLSIYPDYLFPEVGCDRLVAVAAKHTMKTLLENDVEVVDLFTVYRDNRLETKDKTPLYYFHEDTHWRNLAAQVAGEKIAERLKRYDLVQKALAAGNPYTTKAEDRVTKNNPDKIVSVYDSRTNAYYPDHSPDPNSPVILTGDSYSQYNCTQGGHLPAQVVRHIGLPMIYLRKAGLSSELPVELATMQKQSNFLERRKVVVWTFAWMVLQGRANWPVVDLPQ